MSIGTIFSCLLLIPIVSSFAPNSPTTFTKHSSSSLYVSNTQEVSRSSFLGFATSIALGSATSLLPVRSAFAETITLPSGVSYDILKSGDGPKPEIGELAAIRFKALVESTGNLVDDIFETPEPYYTRVGTGGLLKGVEEVIPKMRVGDRFVLTVPGKLAFGPKGRPSSAGKPRIPGDATIIFEVEMVGLPGKEPELIELIGDV